MHTLADTAETLSTPATIPRRPSLTAAGRPTARNRDSPAAVALVALVDLVATADPARARAYHRSSSFRWFRADPGRFGLQLPARSYGTPWGVTAKESCLTVGDQRKANKELVLAWIRIVGLRPTRVVMVDRVVHGNSRAPTSTLAVVAAARVGVGVAMVLAPGWFFPQGSGTETLLMRTVGIRDLVLGSGACAAWARGDGGEFRRWASVGLLSDSADVVVGLSSRSSVDSRSALIATLAPMPFVAAGIFGLARSRRL